MKVDILSNQRINRIVRNLQDELELAKPLTFLNRVPMGDVFDNSEILARYTGKIYAANIIMNDSQATVVETGKLDVSGQLNVIPNIKIGRSLTQDQIEKLDYFQRGIENAQGELKNQIIRYEQQMARELVQGVRETMNWLCASMYLDGVTYDRAGVQIASGFGTPATLKSTKTGGARWMLANITTMDAITDIQQLAVAAQFNYGKTFNRVDMSLANFQLIIQSTAFKNQIRTYRGLESTDPVDISIYNIEQARNLFQLISGFTLNIEDKQITFKNDNGSETSTRVLPDNKVILSSTDDDNDDSKFDFAQGIPQEVTVSRLLAGAPVIGNNEPGIASYYTGDLKMNPPDLQAWAVVKGFPRKHDVYVNGVLTVY